MKNLDELHDAVEKVLLEYIEFFASALKHSRHEVVFDRVRDRYLLLEVGWENYKRIHHSVIHLDIINGKIWIQEDCTEEGIATDLERSGVPKDKIVLGFKSPALRKHTEYATA